MTFSTVHIAITAGVTGMLALVIALWSLGLRSWLDAGAVAVLAGAAVLLWRLSANMPALNDDGLPGFSANDWAAPAMCYLFLTGYADLRTLPDPQHYRQTRVLATVVALGVNVITI
jgi:hypothetical protein